MKLRVLTDLSVSQMVSVILREHKTEGVALILSALYKEYIRGDPEDYEQRATLFLNTALAIQDNHDASLFFAKLYKGLFGEDIQT